MVIEPSLDSIIIYSPPLQKWLYFQDPLKVIVINQLEDLLAALNEIEHQVSHLNRFAAGFLSYEAAPIFDPALKIKRSDESGLPMLWFGIYPQPTQITLSHPGLEGELSTGHWNPDILKSDYVQAIHRIKDYISLGETYQVNYTYRLQSQFTTPAWPFFVTLAKAHSAPYSAFLETESWAVCSFSPELFFTLQDDVLISRPMKGTASRGRMLEDDQKQANWLLHSKKNRAENVMIVDMVRNDLGRIARVGSVRVPELFKVEKYPTVWQMVSTVEANTKANLVEIFRALFPAASITGAPKIRTMELISELEVNPRSLYTGTVGFYAPGRIAQFNVAIRTLLVNKIQKQAEYGVGGGIVWDSKPSSEWEETRTKARVLSEPPEPFDLMETILWNPEGGWFLLEYHLERLRASSSYFSFPLDLPGIQHKLSEAVEKFSDQPQRVRLLLSKDGQVSLQSQPISTEPYPTRVGIALSPVSSKDRFLFHKTTRRGVYRKALAECPDFQEVILWNERGQATEATIANLIFEINGQLYTPPVSAGLLPGTHRRWLLEQKKVIEKNISIDELKSCKRLFLVNSVKGMWEIDVASSS